MAKFSVLALALAFNRQVRNSTSIIKNTLTRTKTNTGYKFTPKIHFLYDFTNIINFSSHVT
jgi:hypothetical protein